MPRRLPFQKGAVREKEAQELLANFQSRPLDDTIQVAEKTAYRRTYAMKLFKDYVRDVLHRNPNDTWILLCSTSSDEVAFAQDTCRAFLYAYVTESAVSRPILGPQEHESVRQVTRVSTMLTIWRALVQEGDASVLAQKRRENRESAQKWRLACPQNGKMITGSVWEVAKWIANELPLLTGISNELQQKKRAATTQDIVVIMQTLLNRHREIVPTTAQLSDFAMAVLCMAIGGFRTECPRNVKYSDVAVGLANLTGQVRAFVRIRVPENKVKASSLRPKGTAREFSVAVVPCRLVCLASHIIARGLARRAFRAGFTSFDELITRPNLQARKVLFLDWAEGLDDLPFISISGSQFYRIWYRCCEVAGMQQPPIPYSMRLGTGNRMIGALGDLLGNWLLMHKSNTHQEYYFPEYVSQNLAHATMGVLIPPDDPLFSLLADLSSTIDPGAPCHLTEDEYNNLLQRKDVQMLQDKSLRHNLLLRLSQIAIKEKRKQYFKQVQDARQLGRTISGTQSQISKTDIVIDASPVDAAGQASFIELLAAYSRPLTRKERKTYHDTEDLSRRSICVLCDPTGLMVSFARHSTFTRHFRTKHLRQRHLDEGRKCPFPSCDFDISAGVDPFYSHMAREHGKRYTPSSTRSLERVLCPICDPTGEILSWSDRRYLRQHFELDHIPQGHLEQARRCPMPGCESMIAAGSLPFCDHMQRTHGKRYTPFLHRIDFKQRERHRSYDRVQQTTKKDSPAVKQELDGLKRPWVDCSPEELPQQGGVQLFEERSTKRSKSTLS